MILLEPTPHLIHNNTYFELYVHYFDEYSIHDFIARIQLTRTDT